MFQINLCIRKESGTDITDKKKECDKSWDTYVKVSG